jgi:predicted transglutaminase-like cysteine proteinase
MKSFAAYSRRAISATVCLAFLTGTVDLQEENLPNNTCGGLPVDVVRVATLENAGVLQKWLASLRSFFGARMNPKAASDLGPWLSALEDLRTLPQREQAIAVNAYVNRFRYRSDLDNFGAVDHWATPEELWRNGSGDCDDFAVAKYLSLRELGFSPYSTWIVLVADIERNQAHAVVQIRLGDVDWVLDYPQRDLLTWDKFDGYRRLLMMNEFEYHLQRRP